MEPFNVPGGNAVNVPTLVPTSPVTVVAMPTLVNAPAAVNNANPEVVPKLGACPKEVKGVREQANNAIRIRCNLFFILIVFSVNFIEEK